MKHLGTHASSVRGFLHRTLKEASHAGSVRTQAYQAYACLLRKSNAIGIYGVISYSIRQRTHEICIRMALGAQPGDLLKLMLRRGMALALAGVAIGLIASLALTRLMTTMLFEVRPTDPLTYTTVALLLSFVAFLACWLPARRATKLNPIVALRNDC